MGNIKGVTVKSKKKKIKWGKKCFSSHYRLCFKFPVIQLAMRSVQFSQFCMMIIWRFVTYAFCAPHPNWEEYTGSHTVEVGSYELDH